LSTLFEEKAVRKIRVLVANRPRLMRELVLETIAEQPDIEIVGETATESEITQLVEETRPDFLIISLEEQEKPSALCGFLLGRYPDMKVLAVAAERNSTMFYWAFVDIRSKQVETSENGILSALRNPSELKSPLPNVG
jgi:chemotaxis response regulator CheB